MPSKTLHVFALVWVLASYQQQWIACSERPPTCDSLIYCHGQLLHTIQMAGLYEDSKSFVDKSLKYNVSTTLRTFNKLMSDTDQNPSKEQLLDFVNENFLSQNELEDWIPEDFVEEPEFLSHIVHSKVRNFAKDIISIWKILGRKVKQDVFKKQDQHSLIPVPNGFIVPGGRFQEYYYWDSYWIIDGLIVTGMTKTARGMIDNFLSIVERYGHIPNGGRVYYTRRSQPPLLTHMAKIYLDATNNISWLKKNIDLLEREVEFWIKNRMVKITVDNVSHNVAVYHAVSLGPRPESYYEDYMTASYYQTAVEKERLYIELKSAAESGWDFSSRWIFDESGENNANITFLQTSRVAPIDLNSFLYGAFSNLAKFYQHLNNERKQKHWHHLANTLNHTINTLFWNEIDGIWYDFDTILHQQRRYFSPANFAPLWVKAYNTHPKSATHVIEKVIIYLKMEGIPDFLGGIPATTLSTGEQWDFPNAWPCLQSIVVEGLQNSGVPIGRHWAREFAERWVRANMYGYNETGHMFEKYDAEFPGHYGAGGEYRVQTGFGWTNGVVLRFIQKYYTD
ncbi:trehalase [Holotrichia oblita]|uniref:Trehalase n=1 Tax=Holotrichia oblita TaxID=644536 RepID=A0ACB9SLY0_HOLOL|nr:trehalase [Holotrichia oblita]